MTVYRHKQIRRFKIGKFQFTKGRLRTLSEDDDNAFRALLKQLPARDRLQIVKVNEAAARAAETQVDESETVENTEDAELMAKLAEIQRANVSNAGANEVNDGVGKAGATTGGGVVRGAMQAADIQTAKDKNVVGTLAGSGTPSIIPSTTDNK